ncbi:MAG: N-acetyl-gamma-glutamyl-phosphate reductase, partial [Mariprofundaceae bacterium]|nr:N-acetyl-gamma-glutamyl-phosphate reductase [Mariprofundaceae bacterium]
SQAGKKVSDVLPGISGPTARMILNASDAPLPADIQLVFTALPHGTAAQRVKTALNAGKKVVDLSADFRHKDAETYKSAYAIDHPYPELLAEAVFGLTEFSRADVPNTRLVANPGCYPTSTLLPLIPLLKTGVLNIDRIIVDSKSGTSGAGRSAKTDLLYCEVNEGVRAYGLPRHRHAWEIEEWAEGFSGQAISVQFVPHILPMTRGMLTTLHLSGQNPERWHTILDQAFRDEPFVRLLPEGVLPSTKGVNGSNRCDIGLVVTGADTAVAVSCLDNLLKGAAGQAVQNANLMFGFDEASGLSSLAMWP